MKLHHWILSLIALCISISAIAKESVAIIAEENTPPMSMEEALEIAFENSGLVEAARQGVEVFESKLKQAKWVSWPHIQWKSIIAPMAGQRGNALEGHTDLSEWGMFFHTDLSGAMPVFTFGKISNLKKAARLGVEVGKAQLQIARSEVSFRIKRGFYGLALARELSEVITEGRGFLDKAKKRLEEMLAEDAPDFDPVDRMKLRVFDAQVRSRELEANRTIGLAQGAIRLTIGDIPQSEQDFETPLLQPLPMPEESLEAILEIALTNRTELVALRTGVKARQAEVAMRRSAFYPEFFLVGMFKYSYSNITDRQGTPFANDPYNGWSAGGALGMRYEFEIGQRIGEFREAEANAAKLQAELREAEGGVRLEVSKIYQELVDLQEMIATNKMAMEAARGWIIAKLDIYDNGMGELKEVLDAVMPFFQTRLDYLKGIHDYNIAVASLERACGHNWISVD